jgi:hypothetical protein
LANAYETYCKVSKSKYMFRIFGRILEPFIITKHVSYVAGARRFLSSFVERASFLLFTLSVLNTLQDIYVNCLTDCHRQHCQKRKGEIKQ